MNIVLNKGRYKTEHSVYTAAIRTESRSEVSARRVTLFTDGDRNKRLLGGCGVLMVFVWLRTDEKHVLILETYYLCTCKQIRTSK